MPENDARLFALELARIAADLKSEAVVVLDLRGITSITDFSVICTGTSDRQMRAAAESVIEYGRKVGQRPYAVAGTENSVWIVVDYIDVVFHIFDRQAREYYDLELLWGDAPRLEWARSETG